MIQYSSVYSFRGAISHQTSLYAVCMCYEYLVVRVMCYGYVMLCVGAMFRVVVDLRVVGLVVYGSGICCCAVLCRWR